MIDVSDFKEVYEWLRENNLNFANFKEFHDCPSPILVEDENSLDEESEKFNFRETDQNSVLVSQ